MTENDPYADLKQHRMTPEILATLAVVPRKIQKRRQHFVKVPWTWIERLANARYTATYRVALHILYRHWKGGGKSFTLSNTAVAMEGVTRWRKWEALAGIGATRADHGRNGGSAGRRGSPLSCKHARLLHMLLCARCGMILSNMPACRTYGV